MTIFSYPHLRNLVVVSLLLIVITACNGNTTPDPGATPSKVAELQTPAKVRRELPIVWAGSGASGPLSRLQHSDWQDLEVGGRVTTDVNGEAWLDIDDCLRVYLFQESELLKAACPKSSYSGGNVTCALAGTSVFNNSCSSEVVLQTLTADVVLQGTWVTLTYVADKELTLVTVAEGEADVWPVVDFESREISNRPITVREQEFLFTSPDSELESISGRQPRVAYPLVEVYDINDELGLEPWLERTIKHAETDRVPFPSLHEEAPPSLVFAGGGPFFEDPARSDAVVQAVNWETLLSELYPGATPNVSLVFPEYERDSGQIAYNPQLAANILQEADLEEGPQVTLLVSDSEPTLEELAAGLSAYLNEIGLQVEIAPVDPRQVRGQAEQLLRQGRHVLWLGTEEEREAIASSVISAPATVTPTPRPSPTFTPTPSPADLTVQVSVPSTIQTGIPVPITIDVYNKGASVASGTESAGGSGGYMVDVVLSTNPQIPQGYASYSPSYREDVLLQGGRLDITGDIAAGKTRRYTSQMGIPEDTPDGAHYICARVDPGEVVEEFNENNNVACTPVAVVPYLDVSCSYDVDARFSSAYNLDKLGCATGPAEITWSAWQPFESGYMLWVELTDDVFILEGNGNWQVATDKWDGGPIPAFGTPPPGLQAPVRGFGYLWGTDDAVFEALGWATDEEKGFCNIIQYFEQGVIFQSTQQSCGAYNWATHPSFSPLFFGLYGNGLWSNLDFETY